MKPAPDGYPARNPFGEDFSALESLERFIRRDRPAWSLIPSPDARTISHTGGKCRLETVVESDEHFRERAHANEIPARAGNSDAKTVYSDTASLQDLRIDDYIVVFANEICESLPVDFCREDLEGMSASALTILEGFASRMGYEGGKIERQIKYIAHRYRA